MSLHFSAATKLALSQLWDGTKNEDEVRRICAIWERVYAGKLLSEVKSAGIRDRVELWRAELSPATINRRLSVLSRILHHAQDCEHLDRLPKIPLLKEAPHVERFLTEAEEAQLLWGCACVDKGLRAGVKFLIQTGCRVGELFSITPGDVRGGVWHLRAVSTKTSLPRSIPLTPAATAALRTMEALCPALWAGQYSRSRFSHLFDSARKKAGLEDVRLHDLRHTFASRLAQKGVDIYTIGHLLGHRHVETTRRYAHLNTAALAAALEIEPDA